MGLGFLNLKYFSFKMAKKVLLIAVPSGGEAFSYQMSQLIILRFVNTFGTMVYCIKKLLYDTCKHSLCLLYGNITGNTDFSWLSIR